MLLVLYMQAFMAEQRDDVTPEECKQRYDEYKADYVQRLTHSFIDVHRKEVLPCRSLLGPCAKGNDALPTL